jgi:hypothetical protein
MASENKINQCEQSKASADLNGSTGRRRFVRGVAAVVPVVLTAGSRSALAATCLSPSASASIHLLNSRPGRAGDGICSGRTPGYWMNAWKTHTTASGQCGEKTIKFGDIFAGGFPDKTLQQVMALDGSADPYQLGAHLAAAWCNWKMGWVSRSVLDLGDLQAMWNRRTSGYTPIAGVTWYAQDIVTYLKTTQTL